MINSLCQSDRLWNEGEDRVWGGGGASGEGEKGGRKQRGTGRDAGGDGRVGRDGKSKIKDEIGRRAHGRGAFKIELTDVRTDVRTK